MRNKIGEATRRKVTRRVMLVRIIFRNAGEVLHGPQNSQFKILFPNFFRDEKN